MPDCAEAVPPIPDLPEADPNCSMKIPIRRQALHALYHWIKVQGIGMHPMIPYRREFQQTLYRRIHTRVQRVQMPQLHLRSPKATDIGYVQAWYDSVMPTSVDNDVRHDQLITESSELQIAIVDTLKCILIKNYRVVLQHYQDYRRVTWKQGVR
ncbi:unnamed protein product, partial [Iphiclides podalirius]